MVASILSIVRRHDGWVRTLVVKDELRALGFWFVDFRANNILLKLVDDGLLERRLVTGGPERAYLPAAEYRAKTQVTDG